MSHRWRFRRCKAVPAVHGGVEGRARLAGAVLGALVQRGRSARWGRGAWRST